MTVEDSFEASRIGIPILSKDYDKSKWCWRELTILVNLPNFPIFWVINDDMISLDLSGDGSLLVKSLKSGEKLWTWEFMDNSKKSLKSPAAIVSVICIQHINYFIFCKKSDSIPKVVKAIQSKFPKLYLDSLTCLSFERPVDHLKKLNLDNHQHEQNWEDYLNLYWF